MEDWEMQDALIGLIQDEAMTDYFTQGGGDVRSVETFKDAGVLTNNAGITLRMMDGSEFQITIVRSK
jgi:hypothetical protein